MITVPVNNVGQTHYFCRGCQQTKPVTAFGKHPERKEGHMSRCKECHNRVSAAWKIRNPERYAKFRHAHRQRTPAEREALRLQKKRDRKTRGHSHAAYLERLKAQGGVCAICRQPPLAHRRFAWDHDHKTGADRDLLCGTCNQAIGLLKDDPELVEAALAYLQYWHAVLAVKRA